METTFSGVFLIMASITGFVVSNLSQIFMKNIMNTEKGAMIILMF